MEDMTYQPPPKFGDDKEAYENASYNLRDLAEVLNSLDAYWWVEAGTCLGCYRNDGKFIPHDTDIDIGILGEGQLVWILKRLVEAGFAIHHTFGRPGRGLEVAVRRGGVKCDLFFFYEDGPTVWMGAWRGDSMIRMEFEKSRMFPLTFREMEGTMVNVPHDLEYYMEARYGPNWRTPTGKWRWDVDPYCINWEKSDLTRAELTARWPNG